MGRGGLFYSLVGWYKEKKIDSDRSQTAQLTDEIL